MNVPLDRKLRHALPRPADPPLPEAAVVPLGSGIGAVFVDLPPGRRARLDADLDGRPVPRPVFGAELPLRSGGVRHLLLVARDLRDLTGRRLILRSGEAAVAQIDPDWLQPPQADLADLIGPLTNAAFCKLLRAVLTTAASLFSGQAREDLAQAALRMMDLRGAVTLAPIAATRIAGRAIAAYAPMGDGCGPRPDPVLALTDHRGRPLPAADLLSHDGHLHLRLPAGPAPERMVVLADPPLILQPPSPRTPQVAPAAWPGAQTEPCRDWLTAQLRAAAPAAGDTGPATPVPTIAAVTLATVAGRLLYAIDIDDPGGVTAAVALLRGGRRHTLGTVATVDGHVHAVGLIDGTGPGNGAGHLQVLDRTGRVCAVREVRPVPYDGGITAEVARAWSAGATDAAAPLAQARAAFARPAPAAVLRRFGAADRCRLRIVTPLDDRPDLIRARAAMILAEGAPAAVEVVATITQGPQALAAAEAMAWTAEIYGVPHRLVALPPHATAGERLRAALDGSADRPALLLGADVLPDGPGWLALWRGRLARGTACVPLVLAGDGSAAAPVTGNHHGQAAGPGRGARPMAWPDADGLALTSAGIARLLAAGAPHPDAGLWIAGALGGPVRCEARFPFRRFGPVPVPDAFAAALAKAGRALIAGGRA